MLSRGFVTISLTSIFIVACGNSGNPDSLSGATGGVFGGGAAGMSAAMGAPPTGTGGGPAAPGGTTGSGGRATTSSGGALAASGGSPAGNGGTPGGGGALGSGGAPGASGAPATGGAAGSGGSAGGSSPTLQHFSFFVTSLAAIQNVSGSQSGFGGDLTFGETGAGAGLRGADKICATIADRSMPGRARSNGARS
jgi:hypothetical protein